MKRLEEAAAISRHALNRDVRQLGNGRLIR